MTFAGAISLAIEDVTRYKILPGDHTLDMVVAETYGEEEESLLQTAKLWTLNVSAYIGPQESCVHEARMAAAFRLPMISYVSKKKKYIYILLLDPKGEIAFKVITKKKIFHSSILSVLFFCPLVFTQYFINNRNGAIGVAPCFFFIRTQHQRLSRLWFIQSL
jgi:Receptor family ligand binding region